MENITDSERFFYGCFGHVHIGITGMPRTAMGQAIMSRHGYTTSKVAMISKLLTNIDKVSTKDLILRPFETYEKLHGVAAEIYFIDEARYRNAITRVFELLSSHSVSIIENKFERGNIIDPGLNRIQKITWRFIYKKYLESIPMNDVRPHWFAPNKFSDVGNMRELFGDAPNHQFSRTQ